MRTFFFLALFSSTIMAGAQALRDINYNYLYNPEQEISFHLKPVRLHDTWKILYQLEIRDTTRSRLTDYTIEWQGREGLSDKDGQLLTPEQQMMKESKAAIAGAINIPLINTPKLLVAKVVNNVAKKAWFYHAALEANYPVNNFLNIDGSPVIKPYVVGKQRATPGEANTTWIVSYYNDNFPAAAPGFSEGQARVSKGMKTDSVINVTANSDFTFFNKGLFLFQKDTLGAEGFAVRAEDDYPRFAKIQNLPGPMIYICTKQEYDKLEAANGDKKIFDRTVLTITGDAERAKKLIRNYFRRVELANQYFTSYKEGWKTDRGMIYIIFGLPEQVFKFYDREVWTYKNTTFNGTFEFAKSSSVFDPDNYVLIREKNYRQAWLEVVDLWRNARF